MQYQVPQFIEVEDKIFGPLTLKQFIYIAGGGGLAFLIWKSLPPFLALPLVGVVAAFSLALAFYRVNNRPFIVILEAAFMYLVHPRLYLWRPDATRNRKKQIKKQEKPETLVNIPNLTERKLQSLAWSLDINENLHIQRKREARQDVPEPLPQHYVPHNPKTLAPLVMHTAQRTDFQKSATMEL